MTRPDPVGAGRVCTATGFGLLAADGAEAWRVAKDRYVATSGITGVLVVDRVGPLPHDVPDSRGRYDTIGRTVYVADRPATAMAEVLQPFRAQSLATAKDADAIGTDLDSYRQQLAEDLHQRGLPAPGDIPASWQLVRSLYRVRLPRSGWWVKIDSAPTLNALADAMHGLAGQLTLGDVCGDDRALTTQLAQLIRDSTLDDGTMPLGISFPSKTAYGRCFAWWNRAADANTNPTDNDIKLIETRSLDGAELRQVCTDWNLTITTE